MVDDRDMDILEMGKLLPYSKDKNPENLQAVKIAFRMLAKHGYYMAMYHCTTLMIHCHKRDRDNRLVMEDVAFWHRVRDVIQKQKNY
jgi:hypothetical protein